MAMGGGENGGAAGDGEFYLRYYVGHKGKFGHEFRPDGKLRYANNSNYKNDTMIRKEVFVSPSVLREARRIIQESDIMEDNSNWLEPDRIGQQELEIVMGSISPSPPPRSAPSLMSSPARTRRASRSSTTSSRI
ncbi:hypothetical protein GQ55_6G043400 [Panicum hallii var. hallii]|uniref:Mago nashi protein n=1 Tax=Panicum hallii var. hallii TaxID=1504633 RepID=A0A2T7D3Q3_9POAL|nr:hypothetical protein GQ55_6G043400 [Panicum hallii var. hallii]